jgi:hypothetical protein
MVVGFMLIVMGLVFVGEPKMTQIQKVYGIVFVVFGNTLFGSGFISLAITQTLGKKP